MLGLIKCLQSKMKMVAGESLVRNGSVQFVMQINFL